MNFILIAVIVLGAISHQPQNRPTRYSAPIDEISVTYHPDIRNLFPRLLTAPFSLHFSTK